MRKHLPIIMISGILSLSRGESCSIPNDLTAIIASQPNASAIQEAIRRLPPKDCALLKTIGAWKGLSDRPNVTFEEITQFYLKHPTWPNQIALRQRAESNIKDTTSKQALMAWFLKHPPLTSRGILAFARVMPMNDQNTAVLKQAFKTIALSRSDMEALRISAHLTSTDYNVRFDARLCQNDKDGAALMLPYLSKDYVPVAQARLRLYDAGLAGASSKAPLNRASYTVPGYLWQYGVYLLKTQQDTALIQFLKDPLVKKAEHAHADIWWTHIRRILVRRLMEKNKPDQALSVVTQAPSQSGASHAEAVWLRGWIQYYFLKNARKAASEFEALYALGSQHVNLSKAAFYAGRAYQTFDTHKAHTWFLQSSKYPQQFYGQMALSELGQKLSLKHFQNPPSHPASYTGTELFHVIMLLKKIHMPQYARLFMWKIALNIKTQSDHMHLIQLAQDIGGAYPAVQVTKIGPHTPLMKASYPVLPKSMLPKRESSYGVPMDALVHAVARQESNFDAEATSPRSAKGLMQLLDGTAKEMSRKYNVPYTSLYNAKDNAALGAVYFKELLQRYQGSLILAIAAYNAGLGRVDTWVKTMGLPSSNPLESVDWIQMIPFRETRYYVEHVLENYALYRVLMQG